MAYKRPAVYPYPQAMNTVADVKKYLMDLYRALLENDNISEVTGPAEASEVLPWVTPEDYGAVGDGVHDDTTAIQSALTEVATNGGTVILFAKTYRLNGNGAQLILMGSATGHPCSIVGQGRDSILKIDSTVGATVDVIRVVGTGRTSSMPYRLENFAIEAASGTPARHGINIDTRADEIGVIKIEGIFCQQLGGNFVYTTDSGTSGGAFCGILTGCLASGGVYLEGGYDSWHIHRNVLTGSGKAVYVNAVAGARSIEISHNNITSKEGIQVLNCWEPKILGNYIEGNILGGWVGSNSAAIDIAGTAGTIIYEPMIAFNTITPVVGGLHGVRLDYSDNAQVFGNHFSRTAPPGVDILVTANATDTHIGHNAYYPNTDTKALIISDSAAPGETTWLRGIHGGLCINSDTPIEDSSTIVTLDNPNIFTANQSISKNSALFTVEDTAANNIPEIILKRNGSGGSYNVTWEQYIASSYKNLHWYADGADRMVLTNSGNLGVGGVVPTTRFELYEGAVDQNLYEYLLSLYDKEIGIKIQRNKTAGSYNTTWFFYVPANSTDLRFYNGAADQASLDTSGNLSINGTYKVDGTQVVSNRVVDARLANVPNSGDATTDDLIDALRDLILNHGLGASS